MNESSLVDLYEEFMELEVDNHLFDFSVDNIYYWELIRREVYIHIRNQIFNMEITRSAFDSGQNTPAKSQQSYPIKKYIISIPNLIPSRKLLFDENIIFFNINDRQMGKCDENKSFIEHYFSTVTNDKSVINDIELPYKEYTYIYDKIKKADQIQTNKSFNSQIRLIEGKIKTRFSIELDIMDYTLSRIRKFNKNTRIYNMVLSLSNTQAIIMRGVNRGLLRACKKQKIPTIQLTQSPTKSHASFDFRSNNINYFSDYLFVPGDSWKSDIDYPIPEEDVYVVGNPYHELKRKETKCSAGNTILIISQPSLQSKFVNWAVEIDRETSMDVILKIHPKADSTKFPEQLLNSPVRVCQDEDLYDLFSKSVIQVGAYSSAVLEGANLGIKTILIDGPWVNQITSHLPYYSYEICGKPADISLYFDENMDNIRVPPNCVYASSSQKRIQHALEDVGINE